ncbi:hypothetical protein [Bosea sp. RAC05]|uniref:hypothetical protein n=1 Tax=Bosea sp. RAC05 TaxID=1842539 RepID=UPI00083E238B|nr:hypothetical protein [Bosea sp. RAC05]AOG02885.1 hypothetical protein BSY19_5207 [Bosea sp. RAC05]
MTDDTETILGDPLTAYSKGIIAADVAATLLELPNEEDLARELSFVGLPEPGPTEESEFPFKP